MSEIITSAENVNPPGQPTTTKTLDQHAADLDAWLAERGLVPLVVAQGKVTGALAPIADFMPASHLATWILQPKPK